MRGTFEQATAYLTQELTKKDKTCGTPVQIQEELFPIKCNTCDFTGYNKYWFDEHPMKGGHVCHRCVWKRRMRDLSLSDQERNYYTEEYHQIHMKLVEARIMIERVEKKFSA